jgi:hypothetical protein
MPEAFHTITGDDWRRSIAVARSTPNQVLLQIQQRIKTMSAYGKYRMQLSDGQRIVVEAPSAAMAIGKALRVYLGRTVTECHSGYTEDEAKQESALRGTKVLPGYIPHDIPPHGPILKEPEGLKGGIQSQVGSHPSLFSDCEIVSESQKAKRQFFHVES